MEGLQHLIRVYLLIFGIFFIIFGLLDLTVPKRIFSIWHSWSGNRFFLLHGLLLIAAGLPLTAYKGRFSTFIFIVGIIMVLSGPFIVIYPEKFKQMFQAASNEFNGTNINRLMYIEGAVRIVAGSVCVAAYFM
ncbi:MAG: hypothetical protein JXA07_06375 [Spirochaetes bacterium]|nr:hypothetical protein [Spirochaetota bacterium]